MHFRSRHGGKTFIEARSPGLRSLTHEIDILLNASRGKYRFETNTDGVNRATDIESGTFANIRNNPSLQQVTFLPVEARFFRFTSLQTVNKEGLTCAAEISVLPAK